MRPDELERRLQERLDALGPAPRAELLHLSESIQGPNAPVLSLLTRERTGTGTPGRSFLPRGFLHFLGDSLGGSRRAAPRPHAPGLRAATRSAPTGEPQDTHLRRGAHPLREGPDASGGARRHAAGRISLIAAHPGARSARRAARVSGGPGSRASSRSVTHPDFATKAVAEDRLARAQAAAYPAHVHARV